MKFCSFHAAAAACAFSVLPATLHAQVERPINQPQNAPVQPGQVQPGQIIQPGQVAPPGQAVTPGQTVRNGNVINPQDGRPVQSNAGTHQGSHSVEDLLVKKMMLCLKTELEGLMLVTAYPDRVASEVLNSVEWIVCVSDDPRESMSVCGQIVGAVVASTPEPPSDTQYRALAWQRGQQDPIWFIPASTRAENVRHQHSYFEGDLEPGQRFVFRGPESKLALQAKNVSIFLLLAEGVDDETWNFHLRRHDYSTWFHDVINDHDIATNLRMIEQADELSASQSRERVLECIRERFDEKL